MNEKKFNLTLTKTDVALSGPERLRRGEGEMKHYCGEIKDGDPGIAMFKCGLPAVGLEQLWGRFEGAWIYLCGEHLKQLRPEFAAGLDYANKLDAERAGLPQTFAAQNIDDGKYVASMKIAEGVMSPVWASDPAEAMLSDETTTGEFVASMQAAGYPVRIANISRGGRLG